MSPKIAQLAAAFKNLSDNEKAELIALLRLPQRRQGQDRTIADEEFGKGEPIILRREPQSALVVKQLFR